MAEIRRLTRPLLALALAAGAAVTACGSSSRPGSRPSAGLGIAFADCMRSHGVPNFPDPGSGSRVQLSSSSGVNPLSPAFQAARSKCQKLLPGAGPDRAQRSAQRREELVRLAECMRAHGIAGFPDPTNAAPPTAPPANGGVIFGGPGGVISLPRSTLQSPGFRHDASVCGFPGFGQPGGAKQQLPGG